MDYKTYDSKMSGMLDKIGTEASNLILDDVALMLSDNQKMNEEMKQKNEEIEKLKSLNSRLQEVNGNLLLQIPTIKKVEDEDKLDINNININNNLFFIKPPKLLHYLFFIQTFTFLYSNHRTNFI